MKLELSVRQTDDVKVFLNVAYQDAAASCVLHQNISVDEAENYADAFLNAALKARENKKSWGGP